MIKKLPVFAVILFAAVFAYGCEKKGPAEKAGDKIDEAYSDALEKAEEAGKTVEEAGKRIEQAIEEAEEAVQDD